MAEHVSISYKGYDTASKVLFDSLLNNGEFADVTIVCDDERVIKAHKIILSAFSPFFKNILLKIPSPNPVIYITGICYKDLLCIFQFIYRGETQVEDSGLESFLSSAEKLKVMGIYPLANFEQKKLPNYSQMYPGVFTEESNTKHLNGNESPADISNMLNVVIKEEPAEEMQEEQENVAVFVKTEEISVKQESIESLTKGEIGNENNPDEILGHQEDDKELRPPKSEIKHEKSLDMYTRIKNRHKSSPKKVNYNDDLAMDDNDNETEDLLTKAKDNKPPILAIPKAPIFANPKPMFKTNRLLKCKYCQFKTVKFLLLRQHVLRIHSRPALGKGHITCNYCGCKFWTVDALNAHKTNVHNVIRA